MHSQSTPSLAENPRARPLRRVGVDAPGRDRLREVVANLTTLTLTLHRLCWEVEQRGDAALRGLLQTRLPTLERCRDRLAGLCVELAVSNVGVASSRARARGDAALSPRERARVLTRARALQDITLRLSEVLVELHGPLTRRPTLAGPVAARLESATRELASDIAAVDEVHRRATGQRPA